MIAMMTMADRTNSMDALMAVLHKNDSNNRHHNWMVVLLLMVMTLNSICWHLCWCHCHIDSSLYAIVDYNSHQSSYHPAYDSWHNGHLDPSLENMDAPKRLVVQIWDDDDCNAMMTANDVWRVFAPNRCYIRVSGDGILDFWGGDGFFGVWKNNFINKSNNYPAF